MATATVLPCCERASRSYRIGEFRLQFFDLGPWREYQILSPRLGIRRFTTAWTPRSPTSEEREALEQAVSRAAHDALQEFDRQLGRAITVPALLGDMP